MSGKGQSSNLQQAVQNFRKNQAKNQALSLKLAEEKAKKAKEAKSKTANRGSKASTSGQGNDGSIQDMKSHLRTVIAPKHSQVPLSKQIKDCLDALQKAQDPLTPAQLEELTGHDCSSSSQLAEHLGKNQKIGYGQGKYRFKAAADVKVMDRHGALRFIQSSKGCLARDLTAAYPGAPDDLAKLKAEGLIRILPAAEKEQEAVFAAEKPPLISISPDIIKLWHEVEIPEDLEEQAKEMKQAGIVSAVQRGKRERPKVMKKEKKKRAVNFDRYKKITNQHLPELFKGDATSID